MAQTALSDLNFKKLVKQANLNLNADEETKIKSQIDEALTAVQVLSELKTSGVPTLDHPAGDLKNILRDDIVTDSLPPDLALSGAARSHNGYFMTKAVFDEST